MTRAEFLQGLRTELEGRVPYSVIQENIRYYDSYISDEISKGADEAEVIENLGGPRIIARDDRRCSTKYRRSSGRL